MRSIVIFLLFIVGSINAQEVLVKQGVYRLHSHIDTNYIYPEWYGANPYDTASDRAAIQSAIEAAHLKNKDVWLGKGTYKLSSFSYDSAYGFKFGLRLRGNVRLVGHGPESRIYSTVNSDSFAIISVRDSSARNLIQDIHIASDSCNKGIGIYIRPGCDKVEVFRVSISGVIPLGIKAQNSTNGVVSNCNITFTGSSQEYAGIKIQSGSGWKITGNTITSDASFSVIKTRIGGGIWIQYDSTTTRPFNNSVTDNHISNVTYCGIFCQGDSLSIYSGNIVKNTDGVGISAEGSSPNAKDISKKITISNNKIQNSFHKASSSSQFIAGIYTYGTIDLSVVSNTIDSVYGDDTTAAVENGIAIGRCRNATVSSNTISNVWGNGLDLSLGSNMVVSNNQIIGAGIQNSNTWAGIFSSVENILITGNVIVDTYLPVVKLLYAVQVSNAKTNTVGNSWKTNAGYFDGGVAVQASNTSW